MAYITVQDAQFKYLGSRLRFFFINHYPLFVESVSDAEIENLCRACRQLGIPAIRFWLWNAGYMPTDSAGNLRYLSGTTLLYREASLVRVDTILDIFRKYGIKAILSFADGPATGSGYNTLLSYVRWCDAIYGTDYFSPVTRSITSLVRTTNTVSATTSTAHGYQVGQLVDISGMTPSDMGGSLIFIRSVPTPTTFTYGKIGSDGTATGTITCVRNASYKLQNFYRDSNCRQMFKDNYTNIANRTNTINGLLYKNDDTWNFSEAGNELRYDQVNDPWQHSLLSHNMAEMLDWTEEITAHMKSVTPDKLITFGSMAHKWQWTSGDTIANGTDYGPDYDLFSQVDTIDYGDFHMYPTQGSDPTQIQKYGQRLGYPNTVNAPGLRAQIRDFVDVFKGNGKPASWSEAGLSKDISYSNTIYTLNPRVEAFRNWSNDFFGADGDAMGIWTGTYNTGTGYSVHLSGWNGVYTNENSNDIPIQDLISTRNASLLNRRRRIV